MKTPMKVLTGVISILLIFLIYFISKSIDKNIPDIYEAYGLNKNIYVGIVVPVGKETAIMSYHQYATVKEPFFKIRSQIKEFSVRVIGIYPEIDLVVLESETALPSFYQWGNSDDLSKGVVLKTIGFNKIISDLPIMTHGIASGRTTRRLSDYFPLSCSAIISDARTNSGFSGGPLLTENNKLIGMNCGRLFPLQDEASIGLYAVPSNFIIRAIKAPYERSVKFDFLEFDFFYQERPPNNGYAVVKADYKGIFQAGDVIQKVDTLFFYSREDLMYLLSSGSGNLKIDIERNGEEKRILETLRK